MSAKGRPLRHLAHVVVWCALLAPGCDIVTPQSIIEGTVVYQVGGEPIEGVFVELIRDFCNPNLNCNAVDDALTDVGGHFRVTDRYFATIPLQVIVNTPRAGRPDSLYRPELSSASRTFTSQQRHRAWFLLDSLDP